MSQITIIMYHYVRPIKGSSWPEIKGLELEGFRRQLDYLLANFKVITAEDVINAVMFGEALPSNSCWLTFDDGYKDHLSYVLPELLKRKIQGSFFVPVKPIMERRMLDVNSVHHILASTHEVASLVSDLNNELRSSGFTEPELITYWNQYAVSNRYDSKEVVYFKRILQHVLPELVRNRIVSKLFQKYVERSESEFADLLYMTEVDIKELVNSGMYVGSHGYRHLWLNKEDRDSQKQEINRSLRFLSSVGASTENWIMCYPYGAYNEDTIGLLEKSNCAVGITTEVAKADLKTHHYLKLPRFDTNDFPQ